MVQKKTTAGTAKKRTNKPLHEVDKTIIPTVLRALREGNTVADACAVAGISDDTLGRWKRSDAEFAAAVEKARADARRARIQRIQAAGEAGNWQADAWFLERSDPQNWGRTTKLILDVDAGLQRQLAEAARARGVDLGAVFEAMINELGIGANAGT